MTCTLDPDCTELCLLSHCLQSSNVIKFIWCTLLGHNILVLTVLWVSAGTMSNACKLYKSSHTRVTQTVLSRSLVQQHLRNGLYKLYHDTDVVFCTIGS